MGRKVCCKDVEKLRGRGSSGHKQAESGHVPEKREEVWAHGIVHTACLSIQCPALQGRLVWVHRLVSQHPSPRALLSSDRPS